MKAIIIKTGEEVNYIGTSAEYGTTSFIDSKGVLCQENMAGKIKLLGYTPEDNNVVNWEQRGYEVAKDILINQLKEITTNDLGEANNKLIYDSIDLAKNFINTLRCKPFD